MRPLFLTLAILLSATFAQAETMKVVLFGDSIGWANLNGWFEMAAEPLPIEAVNIAINGQTLAEMHTNFNPASVADADVVVIEGGTNDTHALHVLPNAGQLVFNRLQTLVTDIRAAAPNAELIVSTITPRITPGDQPRIDDYNVLVRSSLIADRIWDVTTHPIMGDPQSVYNWSLYYDGLHPTAYGNTLLAGSFRPILAAASESADFNGDRTVNTADLALWQSGATAGDGSDLLLWQRQQVVANSSFAAIPEPSSLVLLLAGIVLVVRRR